MELRGDAARLPEVLFPAQRPQLAAIDEYFGWSAAHPAVARPAGPILTTNPLGDTLDVVGRRENDSSVAG